MTRRAILLVPGLKKAEQRAARDRLVAAMAHHGEGFDVTAFEAETGDQGVDSVKVEVTPHDALDQPRELHVYEAYWSDLVPDWGSESPTSRFLRGTRLILYWFLGGLTWRLFTRRPTPLGFVLGCSAVLLLLWYLSALSVIVAAYQQGGFPLPDWVAQLFAAAHLDPGTVLGRLKAALDWAPLVFLIGLFGGGLLEQVSNTADFAKSYLGDEPLGEDGIGVRAKTRKRVVDMLDHLSEQDFDEIFVVAHSLGGALAVDTLADYGKASDKLHLFTWGTWLAVLSHQEELIAQEIQRLAARTELAGWTDLVFRTDIFASAVPRTEGQRRPAQYRLTSPYGRIFRANPVHDSYHTSQDAIVMLLGPAGSAPSA